jgi:YfiH family protein
VTLAEVATPFTWQSAGDVPWLAVELEGAVAAFSTRLGGVSEGPFRSLNLGILTDDEAARVLRNRELLVRAVGRSPETILMGRQVHGTTVETRDEADGVVREADAQLTHAAELTPLVLVADCVPVVLTGAGAVAAVHCGWRGVAAGILERAAAALGATSAALGPGIGACCYEVGDEVLDAFRTRGHDLGEMPPGHLDLPRAIRAELERLDLPAGRISDSGLCTSCNADLFFSHRRDGGVTGRQAGLAWLDS